MKKLITPILLSAVMVCFAADGAERKISGSFFQVVIDSGFLGILIWVMLFLCSVFTLWGIIDGWIRVRREKIAPAGIFRGILEALYAGDSAGIMKLCKETPSALGNVVQQTLLKLEKGYPAMEETAVASIREEEEKIMHRLGYLNLWGTIAPMLGLLGTVTGMVDAFFTLGNAAGVEKAQLLAMSISQALYTTAAGLFISIPAIVAYNIFKNQAIAAVTKMENLVNDILEDIKERV